MPNKKISELNENLTPSGSDVLPIVSSGSTEKISLSGLTNYFNPIDVQTLSDSDHEYDVLTNARYTFVKLSSSISENKNFRQQDKTNNQIGDVLKISIQAKSGSITISFDVNDFYIWECGSTSTTVNIPGDGRNIITFTYDGTMWVSTYDNC